MLTNNPKDPLIGTGSDFQRVLLEKFAIQSKGYQTEHVIGAAINLLVNAIRQSYPSRSLAEARFTELTGKTREILLKHYDAVTGKRKSTFAHTQTVHAELVHWEDRFNKK